MNPRALFKRIIAVALCLAVMIPLCPIPASALTKGTVYVSATIAKVYKTNSTSAKTIGTTSFGQKVKCTSVSGKWAKVKNSAGQTGYMLKSELSDANINTLKKTVYIQKAGLKVHQNASASSKVIGKLKVGSKFTAVAKSPNGRWLRIKNGSKYGYIQAQYADTSPYKKGTKVYMTERTITVTCTPESWDSIGSISFGQSCYLIEKKNSYVKVRSESGLIGYIHATGYLTTENPNTLNKKMYVQADNMGYYSGAVLKDRKGVLNKNAAVTVVAHCDEGWYRVKINGKYYYMLDIVLDSSKAPAGGRVYYANDLCDYVYEKPSLSAKKITAVKQGDKLTLIGCKGSGLKVKTADGKIGYVLSSELTKNPSGAR